MAPQRWWPLGCILWAACQDFPLLDAPRLTVEVQSANNTIDTNGDNPGTGTGTGTGGTGGGTPSTGNPPDTGTQPPPAPVADHITVTVTDLAPPPDIGPALRLSVTANGQPQPSVSINNSGAQYIALDQLPLQTTLAIQVAQQPLGQRCTVAAYGKTVADAQNGVSVTCQVALQLFNTFPPVPQAVIGQDGYTTQSKPTPPNASSLNGPWGPVSLLAGARKLYAADSANHRVLGYDLLSGYLPAAKSAIANDVIGQDIFSTNSNSAPSNLNGPSSVHTQDQLTAVSDYGNHRVLITSGIMPARQLESILPSGAVSPPSGCSAQNFKNPSSAKFIDNGLMVADTGNNRLLYWQTVPTDLAAPPPPDWVFGNGSNNRQDFSTCLPNPSGMKTNLYALAKPRDIFWDGRYLFVAEEGNHRVLIFDGLPNTPGAGPVFVLGQTNFTGRTAGSGPRGLNSPRSVVADADTVFVADAENNRVTAYSRSQLSSSGTPALYCIGQTTCGQTGIFSAIDYHNQRNQGNPSYPTATTLSSPTGVAILGYTLVISDYDNNRILFFQSQS